MAGRAGEKVAAGRGQRGLRLAAAPRPTPSPAQEAGAPGQAGLDALQNGKVLPIRISSHHTAGQAAGGGKQRVSGEG